VNVIEIDKIDINPITMSPHFSKRFMLT
jgi:hypothetical protein